MKLRASETLRYFNTELIATVKQEGKHNIIEEPQIEEQFIEPAINTDYQIKDDVDDLNSKFQQIND